MTYMKRRELSEAVLDKTMQLFWQKGYFNTSIEDILETTGFNRAAIYKHFGDKKGLFVAMLKRYRDQVTPQLTLPLQNNQRGIHAIEDFLSQFIHMHRTDCLHNGCFLISTASDVPSHSQEVTEFINDFLSYLSQLFRGIFESMKKDQKLKEAGDSQSLTDFMVANVFGLLSLSRMRVSTPIIENQIQEILNLLKSNIVNH